MESEHIFIGRLVHDLLHLLEKQGLKPVAQPLEMLVGRHNEARVRRLVDHKAGLEAENDQ